jgi:hypothetical protein
MRPTALWAQNPTLEVEDWIRVQAALFRRRKHHGDQ